MQREMILESWANTQVDLETCGLVQNSAVTIAAKVIGKQHPMLSSSNASNAVLQRKEISMSWKVIQFKNILSTLKSFAANGFKQEAFLSIVVLIGLGGYSSQASAASTATTTSIAITSSNDAVSTVVSGTVVKLTATVTQASGTNAPTGRVVFYLDATSLQTVPLINGVATMESTSLPVGSDSLVAIYSGDTTFTTSTSPIAMLAVSTPPNNTTTTLALSPTTDTVGMMVTATITVVANTNASSAIAPTGTARIYEGTTLIGSSPLYAAMGGVTYLMLGEISAGSHTYTAVYTSNSSLDSSTSAPATVTMMTPTTDPPSTPISTATTLTATSTIVAPKEIFTLIATVESASGAATEGPVFFYLNNTLVGCGIIQDGTARLPLNISISGQALVSTIYYGDSYFVPSYSILGIIVTYPSPDSSDVETTTTLTSSASTVAAGSFFNLSATVAAPTGSPVGTVQFYNGTTEVGETNIINNGVASITVLAKTAGTGIYTAVYPGLEAGGAYFLTSTSSGVPVTIAGTYTPVATTTTLTASSTTLAPGSTLTLSARVVAASATELDGNFIFYLGGVPVGGGTMVVNGQSHLTLTATQTGIYTFTVVYTGWENNAPSTSSGVTVMVVDSIAAPAATSTNLAASATSVNPGYPFTLSATVIPSSPGTPTGTVIFYNGDSGYGPYTLANGAASLTLTAGKAGTNTFTAVYSGDSNFAPSTSTGVTVTVSGELNPDFTIAATPSNLTVTGGQSVASNLAITPENDFSQTLALSCSGLPTGATCTFGTPLVYSDGTSTILLTISTPVFSASAAPTGSSRLPLLALLPFVAIFSRSRRKALLGVLQMSIMAVALIVFSAGAVGCGGKSSVTVPNQPIGQTSTVTVTAMTAAGISHSTTITLTVK